MFTASTKQQGSLYCPQFYALPEGPTSFKAPGFAVEENCLEKVPRDSFELLPEPHRNQVPLSQFARETERAGSYLYQFQSTVATGPTSFTFDQLRFPPSSNASAMEPSSFMGPARAHIPRPPNAFMLFRSDFLKRGIIPSHVERRQQNLSRIAGQCWNLLSPEEKGKWQEEAARVLAEHQKRNPNYKFTPAPRGTRRPKGKGRSDSNVSDSDERIRRIRERYTQLAGPAAVPPRRRRVRAEDPLVKVVKYEDIAFRQAAQTPSPPPLSSSPSLSSESDCLSLSSSPQSSFRCPTLPRRPSTSLGFSTPLFLHDTTTASGRSLTRPSSSTTDLCTPLWDLDITPTAAAFGLTSTPTAQPPPLILPSHSNPEMQFPEALRDPLPFSALNMSVPETASALTPLLQQPESLLSTLYADESFPLIVPSLEHGELLPKEEPYLSYDFPYAFDAATLDTWDLNSPLLEASYMYNL